MLDDVIVFGQNSIKFTKNKKIYVDPFRIDKNYNDADIIFITHDHYDHFSKEDILKVMKNNTVIVAPQMMRSELAEFKNVFLVDVDKEYDLLGISFRSTKAYNNDKKFHPKEKGYVGYIVNLNGLKYYIAGDTDNLPELENIKCDVAFLPIGGTFTMDYLEASELTKKINPKVVVPVHYGSIVGSLDDGKKFQETLIGSGIECQIMLK